MSLNIDGSDLTDAVGGGGGGPSPSDPAQDAKILVLENKTQNIDASLTDGTKTEFINKIVANEMDTPLSTATKFRSSQYYDNGGISGFFMTAGAAGTIQMNKTPYQGTADAIMTLSTNGTIQKTGSLCDSSGNIFTTKFSSSQYYDNAGISGFFMTAGPTGTIQMNKTPYQGTADAIMTLSTNGTIQKSTLTTSSIPISTMYTLTFTDLLGSGALRDEWLTSSTESKVYIQESGANKLANFFITYSRSTSTLTEILLNGSTTGTTSTEKYVNFRDSGGLPNDYTSNELYNITFDAGVGNTWEMVVTTCEFEHSGSGSMYDRLGVQQSADNITYSNVSLTNFYQSVTSTPPWSTSRSSTTDGYIFPTTEGGIAGVTNLINSRFIKFYFTSDGSSNRAGWDVQLTASDAFHGNLVMKDVNTTAGTKYNILGGTFAENNGTDLNLHYEFDPSVSSSLYISGTLPLTYSSLPSGWS